MDDAPSARALRTIVGRLRAAPDPRLAALQRVTSASHRWSETHSATLLDRARVVLAHGAPASLRQVVGLGRQERSMNQTLDWLIHPRANHDAGGEVLARLSEKLGTTALRSTRRWLAEGSSHRSSPCSQSGCSACGERSHTTSIYRRPWNVIARVGDHCNCLQIIYADTLIGPGRCFEHDSFGIERTGGPLPNDAVR